MKKYSIVIAMVLVLALTASTFAGSFADVPSNHWAYEAVSELVAAGLIQGYPDGTFKGQNDVTRYEIAVILSRLLEDIEDAREELADRVDYMISDANSGLSRAEGEEVVAIVNAVVEKNMEQMQNDEEPEEVAADDNLTSSEAAEVMDMIQALTGEFEPELYDLGLDVAELQDNYEDLDTRVTEIENDESSVTFSGSYKVDFKHQEIDNDAALKGPDTDFYYVEIADGEEAIVEKYIDDEIDKSNYPSSFPADYGPLEYEGQTIEFTIHEKTKDDLYVETDPWDGGSDDIVVNGDKKFSQTFTLDANVAKDGLTAKVLIKAEDEGDDLNLDSVNLELENDAIKATYNDANKVAFEDFVYNDKEFDGVTVDYKNYGVETFFGLIDSGATEYDMKDIDGTEYIAFEAKDSDDDNDADEANDNFDTLTKNVDDDAIYAFGVKKTFDVVGIDLNTSFAGRRNKEIFDIAPYNVFGVDTATELADINVDFDFAYSMNDGTNGSLMRLGADRDFGIASVDFNYKNSAQDFTPVDADDVLFDSGNDDYDKFAGYAPGTSGYDVVVKPSLLDALDASVSYASVNDHDNNDNTKLGIDGTYSVFEGLSVNGNYEALNENNDEKNTFGAGAEYTGITNAKVTLDYKAVDPVEDTMGSASVVADESETTMTFGAEYSLNDNISADFSYETIDNLGHLASYGGEELGKGVTKFGIDATGYNFFGVDFGAGFDMESIQGYEVNYDGNLADQATYISGPNNLQETKTMVTTGLDYNFGELALNYDLAYTNKDHNDDSNDGVYLTHDFGATYPIIDGVDFNANYGIKDMNWDDASKEDYTLKVITAGVSLSF